MVYQYTIPRAPIAAMFGSPGPKYGLPSLTGDQCHDPRSAHYKAPATTFGLRLPIQQKCLGPGPAYYPHPKIQNTGLECPPAWTMTSRHCSKDINKSPGPAAYMRDASVIQSRPPAYTMRSKHNVFSAQCIPGPDKYTLPPMMGRTIESSKQSGPEYTMRIKPDLSHLNMNPGPGTYKDVALCVYMDKPPHHSMLARRFPPDNRDMIPGPGAHRPDANTILKAAPFYSFGIKHSKYSGTFQGKSERGSGGAHNPSAVCCP